jgi:hypothetical protein
MSLPDTTNLDGELDDASGPKALRDALARSKAETETEREKNAMLTNQLMADVWGKVGLNPEEGLGLAIAEQYNGAPTVEALGEFASKYGHVIPQPETPADIINNQQAVLDGASATAGSVPAPSDLNDLAKAEAEGDYLTAMAIKNRQLLSKLR